MPAPALSLSHTLVPALGPLGDGWEESTLDLVLDFGAHLEPNALRHAPPFQLLVRLPLRRVAHTRRRRNPPRPTSSSGSRSSEAGTKSSLARSSSSARTDSRTRPSPVSSSSPSSWSSTPPSSPSSPSRRRSVVRKRRPRLQLPSRASRKRMATRTGEPWRRPVHGAPLRES